jgi:GNAT superfamily N-acetyltransferase
MTHNDFQRHRMGHYQDVLATVNRQYLLHKGYDSALEKEAWPSATACLLTCRWSSQILGFACYDVVQMKKGVFGPMGTSLHYRQKGLGKALLHNCLSEMQRNGYAYAIIDNAGPLEFYESACGAVVIPKY